MERPLELAGRPPFRSSIIGDTDGVLLGHRDHRLGMYWYPSLLLASHRFYICRRFVQAGGRLNFRKHYCQQELMGLWFLEIHHAVGYEKGLCTPNNDQHESHGAVVSFRYYLLVLRQKIQGLDA